MPELETYSRHDARERLRQRGILDEVHRIPSVWVEYPYQRHYSERSEALAELGDWETQVQVDLGPAHRPHHERLTPFLDAYNATHRVAVEHERKEQMRARWHLMKIQAANEREGTLDVDVAVLIYPTDQDPSLRRTRRELEGPFFNEHFPISIPVYVIEYTETT